MYGENRWIISRDHPFIDGTNPSMGFSIVNYPFWGISIGFSILGYPHLWKPPHLWEIGTCVLCIVLERRWIIMDIGDISKLDVSTAWFLKSWNQDVTDSFYFDDVFGQKKRSIILEQTSQLIDRSMKPHDKNMSAWWLVIGLNWRGVPTVVLERDWPWFENQERYGGRPSFFSLREAGLTTQSRMCLAHIFPGYLEGNRLLLTRNSRCQTSFHYCLKVSGSIYIIVASPFAWRLPQNHTMWVPPSCNLVFVTF